ncbi:uncharacterized protein K460DRAFT_397545 [Cucurbitaria berberidis CBS 394.84]|uniref:C2H2-type domain-containing protein n=1 Tax=Cucurbitaria berberidis CBS 394.84 TaxID=1168544 RepID=A0A9P4GF73_9PLEO|nr:uncharacterized protein K460DRAFT_397545 [Cucurbitaria berberidis CBS 394.84]KAF1844455.1 hypothetical protein K460DRAFT_397545 [Cucurbitaria berberidis CBS 394.84]
MSPRMPLGDYSNIKLAMRDSPCDGERNGTPVWTRNPFAPENENDTGELPTDRKDVCEETHAVLKKVLGCAQPASCPKDVTLFEHSLKPPRPAPIYEDKQNEEYWTFLKSVPDIQTDSLSPLTRCPSLMSGSTLSSRNSSTRSTRSYVWDPSDDHNNNAREVCLVPDCSGFCSKDVNAHIRTTHFTERLVDTCPVKTCDRHMRGFTRAGDRRRHVFTHFKGVLLCGFCKSYATCFSQASDRVELFMTHLIKKHGVRPLQIDQQSDGARLIRKNRKSSGSCPVTTCSVCSEPFTAQVLYAHLPGCILREVTRNKEPTGSAMREDVSAAYQVPDLQSMEEMHPTSSISEEEHTSCGQDICQPKLLQASVESDVLESKDIEELTASSRCLSLTSSKAVESSEEDTDWTEEGTSRESSPGISQLPRRLSPAKKQVVETIMQEFQRIFGHCLRAHTTGGSSSGSSHDGYSGWSSNTSTYSSASFVSRKRSLSGGGSTPPNDDDDSNKRRRPDSTVDGKQPLTDLRFACPYYKRNPGRHPTFTSCRDPGFTTVARLKEHLYRRHLLPPQCHRCCTTFNNDVALREHQRDARGCEVQEQTPLEGFDKDQERRLKSKKRSQQYQSEEDKWKGVYRILFPDDIEADIPSAYIEYQPCTRQTPEPSDITQFQEFTRLELPRLVRRTLEIVVEQEAQPLEDKLKERLVDIVKECQSQLVNMFQAASGPVPMTLTPPNDAVQHSNTHNALSVFEGFDTLPYHNELGSNNVRSQPAQYQSDSPDAGYNTSWPMTINLSQAPMNESNDPTSTVQPIALTMHENANLDGYYDVYGQRAGNVQPAVDFNADAWSFIDVLPRRGGGENNGIGFGLESLSELDPPAWLGM